MPRLRANRERNFDAAATELRLRFGENVARVRRERGLSQEQLAEKLGCSARYVQYVEHGKANVTIDFIAAVAEVLSTGASALTDS
jgi:transcriptional regulator with XRE-family HTH domain